MKRSILTLIIMTGALALGAKNAQDLRIYLNPGHGSWTSDDRPFAVLMEEDGQMTIRLNDTRGTTVNHAADTLSFYESNTDLWKVLAVYDKLEQYGLDIDRSASNASGFYNLGPARDMSRPVVMSRTKNGPFPHVAENTQCNRPLTEIAAEVENFNADMFLSVHSNGNNNGEATNENYALLIRRGNTGDHSAYYNAGSDEMAQAAWPYLYNLGHMHWSKTYSTPNVVGDITFYGSSVVTMGYRGYLGALRHGAPGYLAEGYFHTYTPGRHRAMNPDVCRIEGYAYARGIADYFGLQKESTGDLYGVIRDQKRTLWHSTYYKGNSATVDYYFPLNGVRVDLYDSADRLVATKTTDNYYNGAFVFADLPVGTYRYVCRHPRGITTEGSATVTAARTNCFDVDMSTVGYYDPMMVDENNASTLTGEDVVEAMASAQMTQISSIAALQGKKIAKALPLGDQIAVLAHDSSRAATLLLVDGATGTVTRTLTTPTNAADYYALRDIAVTDDGYLLGMNCYYGMGSGETQNLIKVYKWGRDADLLPTGTPTAISQTPRAGGWISGLTCSGMIFRGTTYGGTLAFLNSSTSSTEGCFEVMPYDNNSRSENSTDIWTDNLGLFNTWGWMVTVPSPLRYDAVILSSELKRPQEWSFSFTKDGPVTLLGEVPESMVTTPGPGATCARLDGRSYMAVSDGQAVKVLDITSGLSNAAIVATYDVPSAGDIHPVLTVEHKDTGRRATDIFMRLTAIADDGRVYSLGDLSTAPAATEAPRGAAFAYDLQMNRDDYRYTLSFRSAADARATTLRLVNVDNPDDVIAYRLEPAHAGTNYAFVLRKDLPEDKEYNWTIGMESEPVLSAGRIAKPDFIGVAGTRGGLQVVSDPESAHYGHIIVSHGKMRGIEEFEPTGERVAHYTYDYSDFGTSWGWDYNTLNRMAIRGSRLYLADCSDKHGGIWEFDLDNPEAGIRDIFGGTRASSGMHSSEGVKIGGSVFAVAIDNHSLWSLDEDLNNTLVRYALPSPAPTPSAARAVRAAADGQITITTAPTQTYAAVSKGAYLDKVFASVEACPEHNGVFVAQPRLTMTRDEINATIAAGKPVGVDQFPAVVLFVTEDGRVYDVCTSADQPTGGGSVAVSDDGKTLAVSNAPSGITVYSLQWDGDRPIATKKYEIATSASAFNDEIPQLDFDPAGNLHAYINSVGYEAFSLVNPEPAVTTPAPQELAITRMGGISEGGDISTSVESIGDSAFGVYLSENPVGDSATVIVTGGEIRAMALYTLSGAYVATNAAIAGDQAHIDASALTPGTYVLHVEATSGASASVKLIKR